MRIWKLESVMERWKSQRPGEESRVLSEQNTGQEKKRATLWQVVNWLERVVHRGPLHLF